MKILTLLLTFILICFGHYIYAQPSNDECFGAINIADPTNYCSGRTEYTNVGATPGTLAPAGCFGGPGSDVWFSFVNSASSASISVIGDIITGGGGSLNNPEIELYTSDCISFSPINGGLLCTTDASGNNSVQLIADGLIIGQTYLIRVQARNNNMGTFQLCMTNYFAPSNPGSDCVDAAILCDKSSFTIEQISGAGLDPNEAVLTCLSLGGATNSEQRSVWYNWIARTSGTLTFTLTPTNRGDDLDFVVYELPNGVNDCRQKMDLRCNATYGEPVENCGDLTGLMTGDPDIMEPSGCDASMQNGFSSPLDMVAGRAYSLLVNNFSTSGGGFSIDFGGTGEFTGPNAAFRLETIGALECDKSITITNESFSDVDTITSWTWSFGLGATPLTGTGPGPFNVVYSSFGPKTVVLTIEGTLGCQISTTQTIDIASCCADFDALVIDTVEVVNNICQGDSSGIIQMMTMNGDPPYSYSINGGTFLPFDRFINLPSGDYEIAVQDIKGCTAMTSVVISEPRLSLDLGPDIFIELGDRAPINARVDPPTSEVSISWLPLDGLDCTDCFDPVASPLLTTTYAAMIVDSMGCTVIDSITIFVDPVRNVFIPDAFTPFVSDGTNDFFTIYGGKGTEVNGIIELQIFNRWGDIVYDGANLPFGNQSPTDGWDGRFKGVMQGTGVYIYRAKIRFIDGVDLEYSGDLTLIR